jgi:formate dehydrogenase major subunit
MAECHPVAFQWVIEAKARGATVIHIDPRFTRTSALADVHVPIRAGSDLVFLGALINHVLSGGAFFRDYVAAYTNAPVLIDQSFRDTEDLNGLFSGWDEQDRAYDDASWAYATGPTGEPLLDPSLTDPRCVFQILCRHFARYTPDLVASECGIPPSLFDRVAQALCANSGRERTAAFCYAVGWTHHTVGAQNIRAAAILQLLLGNVGRPGGGILALRGHASIQGSTDIPTLFDLLPGYLPTPVAAAGLDLAAYVSAGPTTGWWGHRDAFMISLLKAWWGEAATAANDYCFDYLPRSTGDHSIYPTMLDMLDGRVRGFFVLGENPAVGSANGRLNRLAMAQLEWMVVRDFREIETASFWYDGPEIETGELRTEDIKTEVFFLPAAAHTEKEGTFTNTQRLLQWHAAAVAPPGEATSDLWFAYHLGRRIRAKLAGSTEARDRPILDLTWDYPVHGPRQEPDASAVLAEINGYTVADRRPLSGFDELRADGSTACGCWIYSGCYASGSNQPARRPVASAQDRIGSGWGWAWPANRRLLYNRASADPSGAPWSERKRYVWWDADLGSGGEWTGFDVPDVGRTTPPSYVPPPGATGVAALAGDAPFIMQPDGRGWLFVPTGLADGPLPAHYEPHESPFDNGVYAGGPRSSPAREYRDRRHNRAHPPGDADVFPYVMTTYRLTEHHAAGGMSRYSGRLSELQPAMFCEVSPALALAIGLEQGGWATIVSARSAIEARVLITDRLQPLLVQGRWLHQVGLPYHWGQRGMTVGDSANDLFVIALDPNVHIQECKAGTCDVRPGRRPRGQALVSFVAGYRRRAGLPADLADSR